MKKLVEKLEKQLLENGLTLDITGEEYMNKFNINENDIISLDDDGFIAIHGNLWIDTSVEYAEEIKKQFEVNNDVYWYKAGELDPAYGTDGMNEIYSSCESFLTIIYKEGKFKGFSTNLLEYIEILKNISKEKEILFCVEHFFGDYEDEITICNKKIINIKSVEYNSDKLDDIDIKKLLYQLIILSYDVPFKEVLSILNLL